MSDWRTPTFASLPPVEGTDFRWVGTRILDEEQYRIERFECIESGGTTYWRISRVGAEEYARTRARRRGDRKAAWQARQEGDPEHQEWLDRLVDTAQ